MSQGSDIPTPTTKLASVDLVPALRGLKSLRRSPWRWARGALLTYFIFGCGIAHTISYEIERAPGVSKAQFLGLSARLVIFWPIIAAEDFMRRLVLVHVINAGAGCPGSCTPVPFTIVVPVPAPAPAPEQHNDPQGKI